MYEFLRYTVGDVMSSRPVVIAPGTRIAEVEAIFETHHFNGLPVVSADGHLLGVVTKLDVLKAFAFTPRSMVPDYDEIAQQPADDFMTRDLLTVSPDLPLSRVVERMVTTRYKSLPVVEEGRLVGMVAREDVIRALRRAAGKPAAPLAVPPPPIRS